VSIVGNDTVVETCIDPNKFFEVTSKHNLETSMIIKCFFPVRYFETGLDFYRLSTGFYVARLIG